MATPIQLLQLSPTMSDGTVVKWLVKEGDSVSAGDILAEIETDKAVMEQEAFEDGTVLKLLVKEGDSVPVGANIAVVGEKGEDASEFSSDGGAAKEKSEPKKEEKAEEKEESAPSKEEKAPAKEEKKEAPAAASSSSNGKGEGGRPLVSPLARKMAQEHGLDLGAIEGSGPHGRIVKRDIESALEGGTAKAAPAAGKKADKAAAAPTQVHAPDEVEEIALSGMRKTIARRLVQSRQEIPSFSLTVEVDAQPLLDAVTRVKTTYPDEKVTVTHFIIKAMASTLMRHEWLRTQWVDGKLLRQHTANIPVAVAIEDGLLTPVIRNANGKGLVTLARELRELAAKARDRKLGEAELSGGTQTLSNLGMFGIDSFDAIINPPEASILAVGAVVEKPVIRDGAIVPGKTMSVTLSCDHRVVDGAVGAAYLKDLKAALEDPLLVLA